MGNESSSFLLPAVGATLLAGYLFLRSSPGSNMVRLCTRPSEVVYVDVSSVVLILPSTRFLKVPNGSELPISRVVLEGQDPIDVIHPMDEIRTFFPTFAMFSSRDGTVIVNPSKILSVRRSGYVDQQSQRPSTKIMLKNSKELIVFEDPDTVAYRLAS